MHDFWWHLIAFAVVALLAGTLGYLMGYEGAARRWR